VTDNFPPRMLTRTQAAEYCGYSPEHFSRQVTAGRLPPHVAGMLRWDRKAIDAKLDELSGINDNEPEDEAARWEREYDAREAKGSGAGQENARRRK
jgi:hypothetical protein